MTRFLSLEKTYSRLGIFGGCFDPIHWGHLRGAQSAADELNLDQLAFLPALHPRHKESRILTPFAHRRRMIELCLPLDPRFRLCLLEEDPRLSGTTLDTVLELRRLGFDAEHCQLLWLMGSDSLLDFDTWYRPEELLKEVVLAVLPRPGYPVESAHEMFLGKVCTLHTPLIELAARSIRAGSQPLHDAVPPEVAAYIQQYKLYRVQN